MRYTTARFGEIVYLLGEFISGATVTISIIDLANDVTPLTLTSDACSEVPNTTFGAADAFPGYSTYSWPTSNITTPSLIAAQYLYVMQDTTTGRVQKGKFTVGGFPDASAVSLYDKQVHITPSGTALTAIGTMGANGVLVFTSGGSEGTINRGGVGSWVTDLFAVGDYIQITGANLNNGVFGPITTVTANVLTVSNSEQLSIVTDTETTTEVIVSKNFEFDIGTMENPVDNLYDANLIAKALDLTSYHMRSGMTFTVDFDHANWRFVGDDPDADIVTFDGHVTEGSVFDTIGIRGDLNGRITGSRCIVGAILEPVTAIEGVFNDCGFAGSITLAAGGTLTGLGIAARDLGGVTLDYSAGGDPEFLAGSVYGIWGITNMDSGIFGVACLGAVISFNNNCNGGNARVGGIGEMNIGASTTTTIIDELVRGSRLDENVSDIVAFVA